MSGVYYVRNTRFELWLRRIAERVINWTQRKAWERRSPVVR